MKVLDIIYDSMLIFKDLESSATEKLQKRKNLPKKNVVSDGGCCIETCNTIELTIMTKKLPAKTNTEMFAEQFLAGNYQSNRAAHKTTSLS